MEDRFRHPAGKALTCAEDGHVPNPYQFRNIPEWLCDRCGELYEVEGQEPDPRLLSGSAMDRYMAGSEGAFHNAIKELCVAEAKQQAKEKIND